jgi:hypothetical protein
MDWPTCSRQQHRLQMVFTTTSTSTSTTSQSFFMFYIYGFCHHRKWCGQIFFQIYIFFWEIKTNCFLQISPTHKERTCFCIQVKYRKLVEEACVGVWDNERKEIILIMKEMEPAFNRLSKTKGGGREQKVFQIKISAATAAPLQLSHLRVREDYRTIETG